MKNQNTGVISPIRGNGTRIIYILFSFSSNLKSQALGVCQTRDKPTVKEMTFRNKDNLKNIKARMEEKTPT